MVNYTNHNFPNMNRKTLLFLNGLFVIAIAPLVLLGYFLIEFVFLFWKGKF